MGLGAAFMGPIGSLFGDSWWLDSLAHAYVEQSPKKFNFVYL